MRVGYPLVFGLCAIVSAYHAWSVESLLLRILLANVAASFAVVTVAYAGVGPAVYMKSRKGRLPLGIQLICWPFLFLNHLLNRVTVAMQRLAPADEIGAGLFLGRHCTESEAGELVRVLRIRTVIDLEAEASETSRFRKIESYHLLPVLDRQPLTEPVMDEGVDRIKQALALGPVLVHCALGRGRSAMLVIAYLLATGEHDSVKDALLFVQSRRLGVALHADQHRALERYLLTIRSRKVPSSSNSWGRNGEETGSGKKRGLTQSCSARRLLSAGF